MHCAGRPYAVRPGEGGPAHEKALKDTPREAISCIAHGDDGVVRCSPATRPSPARSCLTATRACRDHHNHRGAPQAGAHSAEAIRLCAEGKQKCGEMRGSFPRCVDKSRSLWGSYARSPD